MTFLDESKPNAARIYDYILGGHHNFEADRVAAERLLAAMPDLKNGMRLNRWFMYHIINELVEQGFERFLDLASGLPTEGYIHELAPNGLVVYNDRDSVTVAYGKEIVGDNPNVRYVESDITQLEVLLH